jgi:phosphoesterase RecJ-like protein
LCDSFGKINITEPSYPATGQLLYDIFSEMGVKITPEIAANLFIGIFSDTGGFKYEGVNPATFEIAGQLIKIYPEFSKLIAQMENSNSLTDLKFRALALNSVEAVLDNKMLISVITYNEIVKNNIPDVSISAGMISPILRTVFGYDLFASIIEPRPNQIKVSFRTSNSDKYDVSKLAASIGGGGHKAAAGAVLNMPIEEAKSLVVSKVKELYNL